MDVVRFLGIFFLYASPSQSQECSPCSCCKPGTGCSYNAQLGIDTYCWGGCKDGYIRPQCQKPCVYKHCKTCSTGSTCDTCYDGYYGDTCKSLCPSTCTTCIFSTVCTSCKDGFYSGSTTSCLYQCKPNCLSCTNGTSCTVCGVRDNIGYYGSDCSMICSNKCKDSLCDIFGNCFQCADPNFKGDNCDRCIDGKYGSQCKNNCPVNCLSCESATNCTSCTDGFKDITCSMKTECPDNCNLFCLSNGKCESCKDGLYGEYCNMTCSQNCRYGYCNQDGSCKVGCEDGFNGSRCEQRICPPNCNCDTSNNCIGCNSNYFGPSCSLTCNTCKDNLCPVDRLNAGKCDECADGTYGNLCNERCAENCLNDSCDQDSGTCTCENEYNFQDSTCVRIICPANCYTCTSSNNCNACVDEHYYGDTCEHECNKCRSETTCRKSDGYCQTECADGLSGDTCDTPCNDGCARCKRNQTHKCLTCQTGRHGYDGSYYTCRNTCNNSCVNKSCDASNGKCDTGCIDGYSGPFCNIACPLNCKSCHQDNGKCDVCEYDYWGEYCVNNCSENCTHKNESLSSCDITSGECKHGCSHGTHGLRCNIKCDQNCITSGKGVRECRQTDGQCTLGCETGYKLTNNGCVEEIVADNDDSNGAVMAGVTGGVIALLSVSLALSVGYIVYMKRLKS
ncbi:TENX-like protein [Mya arenaria]|uniref:TENX-like protein n=1 Tax=Mya arenaria TaxID=6604 RepID=A0ABY7F3V0_MYAAR|nr:TENX-like protein [Mya arenaria]